MSEKVLKLLPLKDIRIDGGTQSRAELCSQTVAYYAAKLCEKLAAAFPPIVVFQDGSNNWLAHGFHRFFAHKQAKRSHIEAEVFQGTVRDAILFSVGCNEKNSLQRTLADRRHAVSILLDDEEWGAWSASAIAEKCKVDRGLVAQMRVERRETAKRKEEKERRQERATSETATAMPRQRNFSPDDSAGEKLPQPDVLLGAQSDSPRRVKSLPTVVYRTKQGAVATMRPAAPRVKPVLVETEPEQVAKKLTQIKRSAVKVIRQAKAAGWGWEQFAAEMAKVWDAIPVDRAGCVVSPAQQGGGSLRA